MDSLLRRFINALAFDNVGSLGELRRRLNAPPPAFPAGTAQPDDDPPDAVTSLLAGYHSLAQGARRVTQAGAEASERAGARLTRWLHLQNSTFGDDLMAGLTVALVAIPQSLAYAQLAGVPAYYGLYAAFIPTIIGALFGSSPQLSTGPTALSSMLTAASIAPLAALGSDAFIADVVLLSLISGVFQIVFGLLRMGVLLNFLSYPVLMGFINAAALIIGLSQLPALLGTPSQQSEHFLLDIWNVLSQIHATSGLALGFGLSAFAMLFAFKRLAPRFPGVLVTTVVLTGISAGIGYALKGGSVVGEIPSGLPPLQIPAATWNTLATLVPAGFVLALISFMEAMSSAKVMALRTRQRWDQNRELVGQGLAKVASAFCHAMPVSGSLSRSMLNAGARTYLSSVIAALAVLLTLLFFTSLLYHVPKSALAAIIMISVVGLIDVRAFRNAWRANHRDGIAAAVTFAATLGFAPYIQNGIITGALLSLGLLLYSMLRPRVSFLGVHGDGSLRDAGRYGLGPVHAQIGALRFDGSLHFVTSSYFEDAVIRMEQDNAQLRYVLVQCNGINDLDASGVEVLRNLGARFRKNGVVLAFTGLKQQVRDVLDRTGLTAEIGASNIFASDREALGELNRRLAVAGA